MKWGLALSLPKGFTLVELMVTIGIFAVLATLSSINFFSTYSQSNLGATQDVLIADLKTAQSNAMSGSSDVTWSITTMTPLSPGLTLTTEYPSNQVTFLRGSGEISGYNSDYDTITISSSIESKTLELNKYGTITGN